MTTPQTPLPDDASAPQAAVPPGTPVTPPVTNPATPPVQSPVSGQPAQGAPAAPYRPPYQTAPVQGQPYVGSQSAANGPAGFPPPGQYYGQQGQPYGQQYPPQYGQPSPQQYYAPAPVDPHQLWTQTRTLLLAAMVLIGVHVVFSFIGAQVYISFLYTLSTLLEIAGWVVLFVALWRQLGLIKVLLDRSASVNQRQS